MTEGKKVWLAIALIVGAMVAVGRCSVSTKHENSLGVPMFMDNPMTYKAGAVTAVAYVGDNKGIVVRVQPIGTYSLFTEDILLCNSRGTVDMFLNKTNPMVLTYRSKASRLVDTLGCHELISVDSLKTKERLP
jgi:hypothetical protein